MNESKNTILWEFPHCSFFVMLLFLSSGLARGSGGSCHDSERAALLEFKSLLKDPSDRLSSWQGRNCCDWQGIRCSESGYVSVVNLRNPHPEELMLNTNSELMPVKDSTPMALEGVLSPALFSLHHIQHLDLSYNNFTSSEFPAEISNLTELVHLNLSSAVLEGSITTQLSNLTSLTLLDLTCSVEIVDGSTIGFDLSSVGVDPEVNSGSLTSFIYTGNLSTPNLNWLEGLRNLRELRLSGVDLSEASQSIRWAEPLASLTNLRSLHLSNCKISGQVPVEQFLNLTNLNSLMLNSNPFNTPFPHHLMNLSNLSTLDVTNCGLQGIFPLIPQLKRLYVGGNQNMIIDLKEMFSAPWPNLEELDIDFTNVSGEIPDSIGNLTSLVHLSAASCSIRGSLPESIANLSRLRVLRLDENSIAGNLPPSMSSLKNLRFLSLSQNKLEGPIPSTICDITPLEYLNLNSNNFNGSLPECISRLPNLVSLAVMQNSLLSGTVPLSIFQEHNLREIVLGFSSFTVKVHDQQFQPDFQPQILELGSCNIGGQIPQFISSLTSLIYLDLANNSLTGSIPSWLFNLPSLSVLTLSMNMLEGTLPATIQLNPSFFPGILELANNRLHGPLPSHLKNVSLVSLAANNFSGHVPSELGEHPDIMFLSVSHNRLSGNIPPSFCRERNALVILDLSNNNLTGSVPPTLGKCTSLAYLDVHQNNLGGILPSELAGAKSLSYLDLHRNNFSGSFPSSIMNFQNLESLNLANNRFEGRIPEFIGMLQNLRILVLASNFFNGSVPQEIMKLEKLQVLSLSRNQLSGSIPEKLGGLKLLTQKQPRDLLATVVPLAYAPFQLSMTAKGSILQYEEVYSYNSGMDLSINNFTGNIPEEVGLLEGLFMLNLSHNALTGEIPATIGGMMSLQSLDLSFNNLNGEIPDSLRLLDSLPGLNLSYNNLSGIIPSSPHMDTWDRWAYAGNKYLCEAPGGMSCTREVSPSSTETDDEEEFMPEHVLVAGIVLMGYVVGVSGFFLVLYLIQDNWKRKYWYAVDRIVLKILKRKQR